jgi:hypothetical protein
MKKLAVCTAVAVLVWAAPARAEKVKLLIKHVY